ncbi:tumor necrosis factor alpha-induced protein 3-like [Huso huso]|uniref:ubiquitinyl hydrolase 1 n=1 Tax=Huso huso TaxID=61971 RepID=A0ABR0ZXL6_HUSHU
MSSHQSMLPQFLFISNLLKAVKIRERVPNDVVKPSTTNGIIPHLRSMHRCTLEMFRMSQFPQQFREVIQNALLDRAMQSSLEQEKKLNWCREVKKLVPLRTNGDGNCLLHATLQYMLGVQDTDLVLRKALYSALKETDTRNFKIRFQAESLQSQEFTQTGLRYNTMNWEEEWEKLVEMASPASSRNGLQYHSLEDIHIFVLANIIRRPIIVIADQVLRSMKSGSTFSPLNVGGIYLPLHWPPRQCYRYPIVLGYDSQHFTPLITIKDSGPEIRAVPLACQGRGTFEDLKIHFLNQSEQREKDKLLNDYMMLIEIPVQGFGYDTTTHIIKAARLDEGNLPEDVNLMDDYLHVVDHEYKQWRDNSEHGRQPCYRDPQHFSMSQLSLIEIKCDTNRCPYYISMDTRPYCHECFERRTSNGKPEVKPRSQNPQAGTESQKGNRPGSSKLVGFVPPGLTNETSLSCSQEAPPMTQSVCFFSEMHAMKCKTPECLFTLNVQHNGLCERCFMARQSNQVPNQEEPFIPCVLPPVDWTGQGGGHEGTCCNICQLDVNRTFNGMCASCMERHGNERSINLHHQRSRLDPSQTARGWPQQSGTWVSSTGTENSGFPAQSPVAPKCKKSGCKFYGTVENLGFCSMCFTQYQVNHESEALLSPRRNPPLATPSSGYPCTAAVAFQNTSRCLHQLCTNLGNSMFEGYCQKCFLKEQGQRLNEARRAEEPSSPLLERSAPQSQAHNRLSPQWLKCARNSCNNIVSSWEELCAGCQRSGTRARGLAAGEAPKQCCRVQGCDHYSNQDKDGYCNECDLFRQIYRE